MTTEGLTVPTLDECKCRDPGKPPKGLKGTRILGGPLYSYSAVHALANAYRMTPVTRDATSDIRVKLDWKSDELRDFFLALSASTRKNSEWAMSSAGVWIPCDVHSPYYDEEKRRVVSTFEQSSVEVYAKFGIVGPEPHLEIAICSLHP